jgi:hypothetical protein
LIGAFGTGLPHMWRRALRDGDILLVASDGGAIIGLGQDSIEQSSHSPLGNSPTGIVAAIPKVWSSQFRPARQVDQQGAQPAYLGLSVCQVGEPDRSLDLGRRAPHKKRRPIIVKCLPL